MKHLLILGAGTAGTIISNILARRLDGQEWRITVVDKDDEHYYQPGFLFVPFGFLTRKDIVKRKSKFIPKRVEFIVSGIEGIDPRANKVSLADGRSLPYDFLIVATGAEIEPGETPGMLDEWRETIHDFYTPDGAEALAAKLPEFKGGRLVIHVNEMPIKCPVAPIEFAFFCDYCMTLHKRRRDVELVFVTPLSSVFTKPLASRKFGTIFEERGIGLVTDFGTERVDVSARKLVSYDGREVPYDLLVTVPTNMGAEMIERSGLGDELRFIPTDPKTLQSKKYANIFVMGDATDLTSSKAGSVAHFQAEIVADNLLRAAEGMILEAAFDGHSNCFIETGGRKAILIDFNFDLEPVPGKFPIPILGPMSLLKETRINHLGKLAFRWIYWNILMRGRPIPFVPPQMRRAGKKIPRAA